MLLKPRLSSPSASTISSAATAPRTKTPTTGTSLDRYAPDTKEREAEADALAADLVQSLSEALLLLDQQWVQQQQQQPQQQPGPGSDIYSPSEGADSIEAEALRRARRKSLWKELGLPLLSAGGNTLGQAGAGADAGLPQAGNAGKTAGKPAENTAGEPAAAGPAALASVGVAGVGEGDASDASERAEAAVSAVEETGRQSLRGDGGQPYMIVTAAVAATATETTAEGFQDANWEALGSRGLAAEEPFSAFGDGGAGGGVVAAAACAEGGGGGEDFLKIDSVWVNIALTFVCVVCAGLAAGLTMGLLSIEPLEMAIKQRSGE